VTPDPADAPVAPTANALPTTITATPQRTIRPRTGASYAPAH